MSISNWSFRELPLCGAYEISTFYAPDIRGGFCKDYSEEILSKHGIDFKLAEVFYTYSHKGVLRGIHFQRVKQQPKLVRCLSGHVFDVLVDLRKQSKTFKQWIGIDLTGENHKEVLIPAGFGHGYLVLKESIVSYKCAEKFYGEYDDGIVWNDEVISVSWPLDLIGGKDKLILSEKDKQLMSFKDFLAKDF